MGVFKNIILSVLALSFVVFCALFGSLPQFCKTPIGLINRLIWHQIPSTLLTLDRLLTGGRTTAALKRTGHYLLNTNHPLVLIFYLTILLASQTLFLPSTWPHLSLAHKLLIPPLILAPYFTTYRTVTSTSSTITPLTHPQALRQYPYDRILFFPGAVCRTCRLLKPARSRHCRICNVCVAKADHHCVWVMNCVGRANYAWFLAMLASLGLMLAYGASLAYLVLGARLQAQFEARAASDGRRLGTEARNWAQGMSLPQRLDAWMAVFARDVRVGAVGLLAAFTAPLAFGLLAYHLYLVWAGMTTSESFKWEEWRDDVQDGLVYKCAAPRRDGRRGTGSGVGNGMVELDGDVLGGAVGLERVNGHHAEGGGGDGVGKQEDGDPHVPWPVESKMRLVSRANRRSLDAEPDADLSKPEWVQVRSLAEVVNIYDLGFWDNLKDCLRWS